MNEKKYTGYGYHGGGRKAEGDEPKTITMSIVCTASERDKIKTLAKKKRSIGKPLYTFVYI